MDPTYREAAKEDRSIVVLGAGRWLLGRDAATGAPKFEHDIGGSVMDVMVHDDRIFAWDGTSISCFHYPSGEVIGKADARVGAFFARPTMLIEGDRLYVAGGGEVICLNMDGQVLWHDKLEGKGISSIAIAFPDNARQADLDRR